MRYLDIAIDAVLATPDAPPDAQFYWTAETTLAVDDWWQAAADGERAVSSSKRSIPVGWRLPRCP